MIDYHIPVLGFAASSGTGKTTLLTRLLPLLTARGLRVALIKHSHHDFEIDVPGKDSYRLRKAGATPVLIVSAYRQALINEQSEQIEPCLQQQLASLTPYQPDLVLVEGFKHETFPKIELHRAALNKPLLFPNDPSIVAIAADTLPERYDLPYPLDLNDPQRIADFIFARFFTPSSTDPCLAHDNNLMTLAQALTDIRNTLTPISASERTVLRAALGRVLTNPVTAPVDLPAADSSAMDGYAFAASDVEQARLTQLTVIGTSWAGQPFANAIMPGQCVRIFTGAILPAHADSVVMQEQVERSGDTIKLPPGTKSRQHVRQRGNDTRAGEELLSAGKTITTRDIALLAASGIFDVAVKRKIQVGFFATGDELRTLGESLRAGQIYDSNRHTLSALLNAPHIQATDLGIVRDDLQQLEKQLRSISPHYDVIISTGGASVGDADLVYQALQRCGSVKFWKLALKPGKPIIFGQIGTCWYFGLPGNPVSMLVAFEKIVTPALQQLAGQTPRQTLQLRATSLSQLKKTPGRQEYQRGILLENTPGQFTVISAGPQDAHHLSSLSRANCFIVLPNDCGGVAVGEQVTVEPFEAWL